MPQNKEYIERQAAIKELNGSIKDKCDTYGLGVMAGIAFAVQKVINVPAADVVEVVRCKDCKHLIEFRKSQQEVEKAIGVCFKRALYSTDRQYQCVTENDYCSYGAKMDKEE